MSRRIGVDKNVGYRAVTVRLNWGGKRQTYYEGIYNSIGAARGRITYWRGHHGGVNFVKGWVESAEITWSPVEGSLIDDEGMRRERGERDAG